MTQGAAGATRSALGLKRALLFRFELGQGARQLFFLGGSEDFLIHVRVRDSEHVRQFVLKNLSANPAVALTETNLVFEHHTANSAGLRTVL